MARYIDANLLFNWGKFELNDAVKYGNQNTEQSHWGHSTLMMYEIAEEVNDIPTADVKEVVRGKWETVINKEVEHGEVINNGNAERCSVCCNASKYYKKEMNVCPNCGADMRKEVE